MYITFGELATVARLVTKEAGYVPVCSLGDSDEAYWAGMEYWETVADNILANPNEEGLFPSIEEWLTRTLKETPEELVKIN